MPSTLMFKADYLSRYVQQQVLINLKGWHVFGWNIQIVAKAHSALI